MENPDVAALVEGAAAHFGRPLSDGEKDRAREYVAELQGLAVPQMLERMRSHDATCDGRQLPKPRSLGGYYQTLRIENDHRRERGLTRHDYVARAGGEADIASVLASGGVRHVDAALRRLPEQAAQEA